MFKKVVPVLLLMLAAPSACDRGKEASAPKQPEMTPAAGTTALTTKDVDQLADARCKKEQRCGNIGAEKKYKDHDHCMSSQREDARDSLGRCEKGVDHDGLNKCVNELTSEDCQGLTEMPRKVMACDDLCKD